MQQPLFEKQTVENPQPQAVNVQRLVSKRKLEYTKELIRCWVESWGVDNVYVAYSGGKDSEVLLHIVRSLFPEIPAVFSNTGLEYREIVLHARSHANLTELRPKLPFHKVIEKYGWPVVSKNISMAVSRYRVTTRPEIREYRLNGRIVGGKKKTAGTIPKKWHHLIDAPFLISEQCCNHLKKAPFKKYEKETGRKPMIGTMISDKGVRAVDLIKRGCNVYDAGHPQSRPLAQWEESEIWGYIKENKVDYCEIYDKGEKRTGCIFCMFGIMRDKDRFIRLKENSPKQWDYVINKLGAGVVLDYLGVEYGI